jgi:hypothetical protein
MTTSASTWIEPPRKDTCSAAGASTASDRWAGGIESSMTRRGDARDENAPRLWWVLTRHTKRKSNSENTISGSRALCSRAGPLHQQHYDFVCRKAVQTERHLHIISIALYLSPHCYEIRSVRRWQSVFRREEQNTRRRKASAQPDDGGGGRGEHLQGAGAAPALPARAQPRLRAARDVAAAHGAAGHAARGHQAAGLLPHARQRRHVRELQSVSQPDMLVIQTNNCPAYQTPPMQQPPASCS